MAAASIAGCLDLLRGDDLVFEATEARVKEAVADDAGYDLEGVEEVHLDRTFEAGGQTASVAIVNLQAEYEKSVGLGPLGDHRAAIFTALSTPRVEVLGRAFNPVGELPPREIADQVQRRYAEIGNLELEGQESVTILGQGTTDNRFRGEVALVGGLDVEIYLHLTEAVESGDDFVIAVGGYPRVVADQERPNVRAMMEDIEHG